MVGVPTVVIVGLGPAGVEHLTAKARRVLDRGPVVLVRTARHPGAEHCLANGATALDHCYEQASTVEEAYGAIVEEVVATAIASGSCVYAVPGSPSVLEQSVVALRGDARIHTEVVPGLSFLDLAWDRLGIDPVSSHVRLVDAERFAVDAAGDTGPLLVGQCWSKEVLSGIKLAVSSPPSAPVRFLHHLGLPDELVVEVDWADLDRSLQPDHLTCLFIEELAAPVAAELTELEEVIATLRIRCPWDREQTHRSLVRHLLEETYEVIEAIDELGEPPQPDVAAHLEEELGDLLCQVMFHARLATEEGLFELADVARGASAKLVHRHPHVFAPSVTSGPSTSEDVVHRWEQIKQVEKGRSSLMEGIPATLPALMLAGKVERKARSADLGWAVTGTSPAELTRGLEALLGGSPTGLGGLLFALARLGAHLGADPEEELRQAVNLMRARFMAAERVGGASGRSFLDLSAAERLDAWRKSEPT